LRKKRVGFFFFLFFVARVSGRKEKAAAGFFSFSSSSSSVHVPESSQREEAEDDDTKRRRKEEGRKKEKEEKHQKKKSLPHLGVVDEVRDRRRQKVRLGLEVRVEDRDVVVVRQLLEPFFQCTGLVARAVGPAQSVAVDATLAPLGDLVVDEVARRLVGGVVEDLGSGIFC